MNQKVLWITKTAVFLALLVVLQWITKPLGTLVTGSVVNFVLIASTLIVSLSGGIIVGIVSPFLALLLGVVPLPIYIVPVVALGNAVIVIVYSLILKNTANKEMGSKIGLWILAIAIGAGLKFGALYAGVNWIVVPIMTPLVEKVKAPAAIFSAQQMLTAAIGGVLAMLVVPPVLKATKK